MPITRHDHVAQDQVDGLSNALGTLTTAAASATSAAATAEADASAAAAAAAAAQATADGNWSPGDIKMSGSSAAQSGWLLCDGSAVSRTTYAALFAAIDITYGAGDGSTTFNLPPFTDMFPRGNTPDLGGGADAHAHLFDDLGHTHTQPNHTHSFSDGGHNHDLSPGHAMITAAGPIAIQRTGTAAWTETHEFTATGESTGTGSSSRTTGAGLIGNTANTTASGTTGNGGNDDTGSTHAAGTTGSTSNVPAYTGVAFFIKL